jgi:hypothetical protein
MRRETLHNILNDFCIPVKLVRLIKMCLNEIYIKVHVCEYPFHIWKNPKQDGDLPLLLFNFASVMPSARSKETKRD